MNDIDNQIEEMAKIICFQLKTDLCFQLKTDYCKKCKDNYHGYLNCIVERGAEALYNAGYRKFDCRKCYEKAEAIAQIDELRAENERIRQNSITHETLKLLMDEKDREIAVLNRALDLSIIERVKQKYSVGTITYGVMVNGLYNGYLQQATKELEEKEKK